MPLEETGKAIGQVTSFLRSQLEAIVRTLPGGGDLSVTVGRPSSSQTTGESNPRLNLYVYEISFDGNLKNTALDMENHTPIWLVLKYILTAFDTPGGTDSPEALEYLGAGIKVLQDLNFLQPTLNSPEYKALFDNPEPLKITFDEASADLLSKIMQGSEDKYLFSVAFQVRPVMIASGKPPSYPLLVGIDYTESPPETIGEEGIGIDVFSALDPVVTGVSPRRFEVEEEVTIYGRNLAQSGLDVELGSGRLKVLSQKEDHIRCLVNGNIGLGDVISAGNHALRVVKILPGGKRRSSNVVGTQLLPCVESAGVSGLSNVQYNSELVAQATIEISGRLLGTENDDIIIALLKNQKAVKIFESKDSAITVPSSLPHQSALSLNVIDTDMVPPDEYSIIVRINGQMAKARPKVNLVAE
jgi:hypothetical protein